MFHRQFVQKLHRITEVVQTYFDRIYKELTWDIIINKSILLPPLKNTLQAKPQSALIVFLLS